MKIGKVKQGVEIPKLNYPKNEIAYPWPDMEVGDAVLIQPEAGELLVRLRRKTGRLAQSHGGLTGKKFRSQIDHSANGVRIWRTE